jgi:AraC-like DNA-binding protein
MRTLAEIRTLISRHARVGEISAPLPGLRLVALTAPTAPLRAVYQPTFALVAQGAKRTVLGDRVLEYSAGQYLVVSVDLPIVGQVFQASGKHPYLAVAMALNPTVIATLLLETAAGTPHPMAGRAGLQVGTAAPDLLDCVARLLQLIDRRDDFAVLGPMLEREILWRLLTGEQGVSVRQIGLADSRLSQISRAIQWIRGHYAEALRIEDLAKVAAMSTPTFFRHFRAVTTMSPLQYQKTIRLQQARARLMAKGQDVAAIGFAVGYDSPSQFSREYSRYFGMPPGKDMARLRTVSALDGRFA